jgi:hypothetical protein
MSRQSKPPPGPGFVRRVDEAVHVGQGSGVANPGEGVQPNLFPGSRCVDRSDEQGAEQVVKRRLGGFLAEPFIIAVVGGDGRKLVGVGDVLGGEVMPMFIGRFEQWVQDALGQGNGQIQQQNQQQARMTVFHGRVIVPKMY